MSTDTATVSTDLQPIARTLFHPATGQVIDLDTAPTDEVALFVLDVQDTIDHLKLITDTARTELTCRMDKAATWTWNGPDGLKATAASPSAGTVTYNARPLLDDLLGLVSDGVIDQVAADNAVEVERPDPRFKVRAAGINALRKIPDPRVAVVIERHTNPAPAPKSAAERKATVKRV